MDILATICLAVTAVMVVFIGIAIKNMTRELRKLERTMQRIVSGLAEGTDHV